MPNVPEVPNNEPVEQKHFVRTAIMIGVAAIIAAVAIVVFLSLMQPTMGVGIYSNIVQFL